MDILVREATTVLGFGTGTLTIASCGYQHKSVRHRTNSGGLRWGGLIPLMMMDAARLAVRGGGCSGGLRCR